MELPPGLADETNTAPLITEKQETEKQQEQTSDYNGLLSCDWWARMPR